MKLTIHALHRVSASRPYRLVTMTALAAICAWTVWPGEARAATPWSGVPVVQPIIPPDAKAPVGQFNFNNLAWQQFIALNWVANPASPGQPNPNTPASAFGKPGDSTPVVWETFKENSEVFRPNGQPPTPWGAKRALPTFFNALPGRNKLMTTSSWGTKGLSAASKFTDGPTLDLSDFGEAFTGGAWLTAQPKMNSNITLFEKRLNQDEFNYIVANKLYNAANQSPFAKTQGINLPDGSSAFISYGTVGAVEIKAAWIQLDDPTLWPLYKISKAYVSYPTASGATPPKLVTVGLVAIHIIRKTPNAQQFVWSTFEHVNNAPSTTDISNKTLKAWYTYFNLACNPASDYYKCAQNQAPIPGKDPYTAPVQVVRSSPISNSSVNNIVALNQSVWATIAAANAKSVFLNYQLVNVLWPNANTSIPAGATTPLTDGDAQPPLAQQPVANTVLETYHQNLNCLSCHTAAPVASTTSLKAPLRVMRQATLSANPPAPGVSATTLASDYSFLFGEAQTSPLKAKSVKP